VAGLQNTWICALDLRLIRADRIVSLLVPVASGYGPASPGDLSSNAVKAIYAEIDGGTEGDVLTRVKLACAFVFAEQDPAGHVRWVTAGQLPAAWPQSTSPEGSAAALTRSPFA